jgi:predicted DNA-binding protein YlxM (UPF0122 family)
MSKTVVKVINSFFRCCTKAESDLIKSKIVLTERQSRIFELYYIKKQSVDYIADSLGFCQRVIKKELEAIRTKIIRVLP